MRSVAIVVLAILAAGPVSAGRTPGVSMSAFEAAVPDSRRSAVFSPYGFELDAVVISEAFGPIEKARYVEALGALVGYENVYRPVIGRYADAVTNGFTLVSSRAFLVSSLRQVSPKFRAYVQSEYGAHACPVKPTAEGAESFFRASMDGDMEDFRVPEAVLGSTGVSFVDLESLHVRFAEPFPSAGFRKSAFVSEAGVRTEVETMSGVRAAELWATDRFTMLRLPMTDGSFFHAVLPAASNNLASVRGEFSGEKLDTALVMMRSITDAGVFHGKVAVVLPKLKLDTVVDLEPAFHSLGLPTAGFKEITIGGKPLAKIVQRTRFVLDGSGPDGAPGDGTAAGGGDAAGVRRFVCDRPFLFFVYHQPTRTIPVAGVFAGDNP